ncbi:hypothetical protein GH714_002668 [Hevea brasiliensis]|uniref:Retrotransposon gag domain-containing protein n=1 Tax=Hevea brasiliensis TaxID=3981 RepID=A0A6A6KHI8_HEVBR|nr:hypothetical protein GH714_002668 [Hevea brasiliensis]
MSNRDRASNSQEQDSGLNVNFNANTWGSNTKLEFPRFSGEGLESWLLRSEYFFKVGRIAPENRVKVAALHLEGKAIKWHQGFVKVRGNDAYVSWEVRALGVRFGSHAFDDPLAELRNLRQVYVLQVKEVIDEEELKATLDGNEGVEDTVQEGQLSLNAIWGSIGNQTMMLKGNHSRKRLHILIDVGSTHNFLRESLVKQLRCVVTKVFGIWVEIASGNELKCETVCKDFQWTMQNQKFAADVYILPLESYDLIWEFNG